jgi:primosomal protein N'
MSFKIICCPHCGEPSGEGEIYCTQCGTKNEVVERCPRCGEPMIKKKFVYECDKCNIVMSR